MSDLVERVAEVIALSNGHSLYDGLPETPIDACASAAEGRTYYCKDDYRDLARAAIKAVAVWMAEDEDRECNPIASLLKQLEGSE